MQTRLGMDTACLAAVADADAADCALAERAFVQALDGGCSSPVAAYATVDGPLLPLPGLYVSEDETIQRKGSLTGQRTQAQELGQQLAHILQYRR